MTPDDLRQLLEQVRSGQLSVDVAVERIGAPPVAAPAVRVQVPSVGVRVRPPALLGRDLPAVRAEPPAVTVASPAAVPALGLG